MIYDKERKINCQLTLEDLGFISQSLSLDLHRLREWDKKDSDYYRKLEILRVKISNYLEL